MVRMKQQRFGEARDALLKAVAVDPRSPKAHYQLSLAYARLGDEASSERHRELYQQKLREIEELVRRLRTETGLSRSGGGMRP
jgi:Tfp pilus assembly protein PilF